MTRADELALEKRKVVALESMAASLRLLTGEEPTMVAKRSPMMTTTPAAPAPVMVQEEPAKPAASELEDDEVEPMTDEDDPAK